MLQFTPGPSKTPASAVFVDMPRSTGDMSGRSSQFLTPDAIETSPIMADSSGFFDAQDSSAFEAMDTDD